MCTSDLCLFLCLVIVNALGLRVGLFVCFYLNWVQVPSCKIVFYDPSNGHHVKCLRNIVTFQKKLIAEMAHQDFLWSLWFIVFFTLEFVILQILCNMIFFFQISFLLWQKNPPNIKMGQYNSNLWVFMCSIKIYLLVKLS